MSDNESTDDPIPGWPQPPASGPGGGSGVPQDPTTPASPFPGPPPAAPAPGAYPSPGVPPGPGGYGAPSVPPAPGTYAPGGYAPPAGYGYGAPAGYGAPGGYAVARDHPQGTTILVLGILSWVVCGLCAPFAWIMGNKALQEIDRNPSAYSNRGNVQVGRILGMVYSIIALVMIALFIVLIVIGIASGSTTSG